MKSNTLRYAGITHQAASVMERENFVLDKAERKQLRDSIQERFNVHGVLILSTCNRTEIYFESKTVEASEIRDHIVAFVRGRSRARLTGKAFTLIDNSLETADFLLQVANGLKSAVLGDKQIISQVKEAYQASLDRGDQGSVLERAFQAVFRSHKRISNESLYRSGSTSTAYSALKLVEHFFQRETLKNKKLLVVGAGEIAADVLHYVTKFSFEDVFVANRTEAKASQLAGQFNGQLYPWHFVEENKFAPFDAVITAVSHRRHLVGKGVKDGKKRVFVDLSVPVNINPGVEDTFNTIYNIDDVTGLIDQATRQQQQALKDVRQIIQEELNVFSEWLEKGDARSLLSLYKEKAKQAVLEGLPTRIKSKLPPAQIEHLAEVMANKMIKRPAIALHRIKTGKPGNIQINFIQHPIQNL